MLQVKKRVKTKEPSEEPPEPIPKSTKVVPEVVKEKSPEVKKKLPSLFDDDSPLFNDDIFGTNTKFSSGLFDSDTKPVKKTSLFDDEPEEVPVENKNKKLNSLFDNKPNGEKNSLFDNESPKVASKSSKSSLFSDEPSKNLFSDKKESLFSEEAEKDLFTEEPTDNLFSEVPKPSDEAPTDIFSGTKKPTLFLNHKKSEGNDEKPLFSEEQPEKQKSLLFSDDASNAKKVSSLFSDDDDSPNFLSTLSANKKPNTLFTDETPNKAKSTSLFSDSDESPDLFTVKKLVETNKPTLIPDEPPEMPEEKPPTDSGISIDGSEPSPKSSKPDTSSKSLNFSPLFSNEPPPLDNISQKSDENIFGSKNENSSQKSSETSSDFETDLFGGNKHPARKLSEGRMDLFSDGFTEKESSYGGTESLFDWEQPPPLNTGNEK